MTNTSTIPVKFPVLARVEGEGALEFSIVDEQIQDLKLRIFEPPRYFETFLQGRHFDEVPDIVARICGICPVAYQMSAVQALESILAPDMPDDFRLWLHNMRHVLYCGEWIQSHALHIHLLAAPDLFGFNSAITMAKKYPDIVRRGVSLQALGNELIALFGGRSVHPVGVKVGGFHKAPGKKQVTHMLSRLESLKQDAYELVLWLDTLDLPHSEQDFTSVALQHEQQYAIYQGRIVSDQGLKINARDYKQHFKEFQQPQSTAFHSHLDDQPYLLGPLARLNLNSKDLHSDVRALMDQLSTTFPSKNMFHSITARGIEIYSCILKAIELLSDYAAPAQPWHPLTVQSGSGYGCSEAPRGLLWHYYKLDDTGHIIEADIIPPTSQNQARIEEDLRLSLQEYGLHHSNTELRQYGEMVIRNYDPCISCATHFLKLKING
ncbi:MAG: Ni/Fe hydrogenase subunit alpha [Gammaproteobacteria bacterium]|nr:Ni/Fe hydrogenase subunit alpha [Gammaproteobacteria bacterium]